VAADLLNAPSLPEQIAAVAGRSVTRTLRQRRLLILPVLFPLILFAINSSALTSATKLAGFPPVSYRSFALAVPFLMGAMLVAVNAGTDLARDIETGFFNRLALTPLRPAALLAGQLGGSLVVATIQSIIYLLVGIADGVSIATGIAGAFVILALSVLMAFGFAGLGTLLALRLGSGEAIQGFFPILFVTIFLSSAFLPRNLIKVRFFHDAATYNPVTYLIEGERTLITAGWDGRALALGFGFSAALAVITIALASASMKTRMVRT
jgi:ABC-2 type transport system permease protein